jgi:voltage-gated potassium channel
MPIRFGRPVGQSRSPARPSAVPPRVHPEFHRHLLLVCLAVIVSWVLPGAWVQLSGVGFLYLTALLGWRLGPFGHRRGRASLLRITSADTHYLLLAIATGIAQLVWLLSPTSLQVSGMPLLALFTLFIAWSMWRLLYVLAGERRIDGRTLCGATAGYLLLGISGGLLLTVLDSVVPGGFYDNFTREALTMPTMAAASGERISWDLNYGRLNYFAFVSLTTLGYGDITPVVPLTRLACLALSVLGPLYIAVVLGVLISRLNVTPPTLSPGSASQAAPSEVQPSQLSQPSDPPPSDPSPAPAGPGPGPDASGP